MPTAMLLIVREVAESLKVSPRRVHALIASGRLPAHRASPDEIAFLLTEGRVKSVPPSGVFVIDQNDVGLVAHRPTGYPKGKPRPLSP